MVVMKGAPLFLAKNRKWVLTASTFFVSLLLALLPVQEKFLISGFVVRISYAPFFRIAEKIEDLSHLAQTNRELLQAVVQLRLANARLKEAQLQQERLREKPEFTGPASNYLTPATIFTLAPDQPPRSAIINAGTMHNVRRLLPVIDHYGVVGKISAVSTGQAVVQLFYDPAFRVAARDQRSRVLGIVRYKQGLNLVMDNVPNKEDVQPGDTIITSGLGGIFPAGILIGQVHTVHTDSLSIFKSISVEPAAQINRLEEIFVLNVPLLTEPLINEKVLAP